MSMDGTTAPGCPFAHGASDGGAYDPFHHDGMHAALRAARPDAPVFFAEEIGYWVLTRRDDIMAVLQDPDRFSAQNALMPIKPFPQELVDHLQAGQFTIEPTQVNCDRPKHTRIRNAAVKFLNPKTYLALEPEIRRITQSFIAKMHDHKTVDLVDVLTYELPARIVFLLLGIPEKDARMIKEWGDNRLYMTWGRLDDDEMMEAGQQLLEFWHYCRDLVSARLKEPRDDYPSTLIKLRDGDDSVLSENEIVSLVFGLLLAGHETTTNASSNLILELLKDNAAAWQRLVEDPQLIPNAVEEGLRYASSVVAWRRFSLEDVEIDGVAIPKGSHLLLSLASANRDEAYINDAESFDIARPDARQHTSFGNGTHFCVGAPLARLEMRVILEELTKAFPNMRLVPEQQIDWVRTISFRGPKRLNVTL